MNKVTTLVVQTKRPKPLPSNDWMERQEAVSRTIFDRPSFIFNPSDPYPCGTCFPEMAWIFAVEGGSYNLYDDQGNLVGTIDDSGVLTLYTDVGSRFPVIVDAVLVSGNTYSIPSDPLYITDVWLDNLFATHGDHWRHGGGRTVIISSPIAQGTQVRVAYVSQ